MCSNESSFISKTTYLLFKSNNALLAYMMTNVVLWLSHALSYITMAWQRDAITSKVATSGFQIDSGSALFSR